MTDTHTKDIDRQIDRQKLGWSLGQPFYQDSCVFQRECERLFPNQWIMAGHIAQVPDEGDYFLFNMAGESVIVLRGPEDAVLSFSMSAVIAAANSCIKIVANPYA